LLGNEMGFREIAKSRLGRVRVEWKMCCPFRA
jgi:hypothetical protein